MEVCPESLGAMLEYCYIECGLLVYFFMMFFLLRRSFDYEDVSR